MSTLHIVSSSPLASVALDRALRLASKGDAILLIENGVYGAADVPDNLQRLAIAPKGLSWYVLSEDMSARALFLQIADFKSVSYSGFVELVCQHHNSVSWS